MDTKQQLTLAWTVAVILAILLAISLYFVWKPSQANLSATADKIRSDCAATDQASKNACGNDLQELSDLLRTFNTNLSKTASTTGQ